MANARGRPPKVDQPLSVEIKPISERRNAKVSEVQNKKVDECEVKRYRCTRCGVEVSVPSNKFWKINSNTHRANNGYFHLCKNCINELYEDYLLQYGDKEKALIVICHLMDIKFNRNAFYELNDIDEFTISNYLRKLSIAKRATNTSTFTQSLMAGDFFKSVEESRIETEDTWSIGDKRIKNEVVALIGYDPFIGNTANDRKALFGELIKWLDDDEVLNDPYKLTQIVNNNHQIKQCDIAISSLNLLDDTETLKILNTMKRDLVANNDKIAKENGISAKNKMNKRVGRGTLTGLMREARDKNFSEIETNFYNQRRSQSAMWAAEVSMKALKGNMFLDENDVNEIFEEQKRLNEQNSLENMALAERNRLAYIELMAREKQIKTLENKLEQSKIQYDKYKFKDYENNDEESEE